MDIEVFNVIVTDAPLVALASAYHISVVTPLLLNTCVARVQVVPVCEMLETVLAPLFLVETTAINVFPLVGAAPSVTVQEVAPFALPVVPVADCTLDKAVGALMVLAPTSSRSSVPLPVKVRFPPSRLLDIVT
ncbi:MAG: hypothetical protein ACK528_12930, partial [Alphaproteobacteria bacterium]